MPTTNEVIDTLLIGGWRLQSLGVGLLPVLTNVSEGKSQCFQCLKWFDEDEFRIQGFFGYCHMCRIEKAVKKRGYVKRHYFKYKKAR